MVSWKVFRESAVEIVGEDLVGLIEKSFKKSGKEIDPSKVADILHKHEKIDESEKDLLNEAYELLLEEEEARTIPGDTEEPEDAVTFADDEEIFEQERPDLPKLKKFTLVDIIGQGGMGRVYKGVDPDLGRPVAVKEILGKAKDYQKQRFQREILLTAKLDQEHRVIRARAVDTDDERNTYFVMDFVEGKELTEYVENIGRGRTYSLENAIELLAEALDAMSAAHKKGIIHRDIKPDNIMADRRNVKIMDWGLAKELDDEEIEADAEDLESTDISRTATYPNLTQDGIAMGTPAYMSPEQAMNAKYADERSDVYSFGAILYEMLTGESPNKTNIKKKRKEEIDIRKILVNIVDFDKPAVPPSKLNKNVPAELESICMKALEKDPDKRYQTAQEFRDDLRAYLKREAVTAHRYSVFSKIGRFIQKHTAAAASAFIIITALGIGGVVYQGLQAATARAEARAEKEAKEKAKVNAKLEKKRADDEERKRKEAEKKNLEFIAESHINKASTALHARNWEKAIQEYTKAINHVSRDYRARANRANAYKNLAQSKQNDSSQKKYLQLASKDMEIAIKEKPKRADLRRIHANIQWLLGNMDAAERTFQKAESMDKENLDLLADISTFYQTQKKWGRVIDTCSKMLEIKEGYRQAHVGLMNAYYEAGNLEKVEEHARFLVDSRQLPNAWLYLGKILYEQAAAETKDKDARIKHIKEAKYRIDIAMEICSDYLFDECLKYKKKINQAYEQIIGEKR